MQIVNKDDAIVRAMNGDHIYLLMPIEQMNLKELGERVKAGATFMAGDPKSQEPPMPAAIIDNAKVPAPPNPCKYYNKAAYDKDKLIALYDAGWMRKDIAVELGITCSQVNGAIQRAIKKRKKEAEKKNVNKNK